MDKNQHKQNCHIYLHLCELKIIARNLGFSLDDNLNYSDYSLRQLKLQMRNLKLHIYKQKDIR